MSDDPDHQPDARQVGVRRVITGHNAEGKAVIVADERTAASASARKRPHRRDVLRAVGHP